MHIILQIISKFINLKVCYCSYKFLRYIILLLLMLFVVNSYAYLTEGVCVITTKSSNKIIDIINIKQNLGYQAKFSPSTLVDTNEICDNLLHNSVHKYQTNSFSKYYTPAELLTVIVIGNTNAIGEYYFPKQYKLKNFLEFISYKTNNLNKQVDFTIKRHDILINNPIDTNISIQDKDILLINKFIQLVTTDINKPKTTIKKINVEQPNLPIKKQAISKAVNKAVVTKTKIKYNKDLATSKQVDYVIMPGDIMQINLPGETKFNKNFLVDREGKINLPEVGSAKLEGLTIDQAIKLIYDKLSVVFLSVNRLTVTLKEKRVLIKVLGYVANPGEIDLPSDSNIQMAVNAVGGFKDGAMLSKLQLLRNNKKQDVNFKKYLETGDEIYLPKLKTLDIIFVPSSPDLSDIYGEKVAKKVVDPTQDKDAIKVIGEVIKPGSLSYKAKMTAVDALLLSGGVTRYADDQNIRVINSGKPKSFSLTEYMKHGDKIDPVMLDKGATIYVPIKLDESIIEDPTENPDSIKVFGEVVKPGVHEYKKNISLIDLLLLSGGVTRYANVDQIRIISEEAPQFFNLKSYLDGGIPLPVIAPGSTIFIPKQVESISSGENVVYIMGQVHKPGAFETGENVSFMDVLANAGGPNRFADTRSIRVLKKAGKVIRFNLDDFSEGIVKQLPKIDKGDSILVPRKSGDDQGWLKFPSDQTIKIMGSVKAPGRYPWADTINFMDLLAHAGGAGEKADIAHIKLIYSSKNGMSRKEIFNLQGFLEDDGSDLPKLEGGLTIVIPELPTSPTDNKSQWVLLAKEQAIYILGAVNTPGRYAFNERLDVMDILTAADGPKDDADLSNITIVHRSEGKERLSVLNLIEYFDTGDESLLPIVKPGDSIYVHSRDASTMSKEQTITVLGEVNKTGRYVYRSGISLIDVLSEAGGTKNTADLEKIIIKRNKHKQIIFDLQEYMDNPDEVEAPELQRGDTIFITDSSSSFVEIIRTFLKDLTGILPLILLFSGTGS